MKFQLSVVNSLSSLSVLVCLFCCLFGGEVLAFSPQNTNNNRGSGIRSTISIATTTSALANTVVDIDEMTLRDIPTMDDWTMQCGVQRSEGFQLASCGDVRNDEYSVITTEPLAAGSPVCLVPQEMIFSSEQIHQELLDTYGNYDSSDLQQAEQLLLTLGVSATYFPQYYLFLKVLLEYEKGTDSAWYPWMNSLPRKFANGASMTPYCYECLPPLVSKLSMNERVKFINFYQSLQKISFLSPATTTNKDIAKWAYNIVYTRCFGTSLVPLADMFNHATDSNVEIQTDEQGNCVVYTTLDVEPNTPLTLRYGDPTNPSHLFATYGFVDDSSPATFCKIMSIKPTPTLVDLGLDFTRMLFFKDTGDITEEVWDVLLYTVLEEQQELAEEQQPEGYEQISQELQLLQKEFYQAHMNGDGETKNNIHQQYFPYTLAKLKNHVDSFLLELDDLSEKAYTKDPREHPRIPIIVQHNDFVRQTFTKVQEKLNTM
mmetsp:Transcript_22517/g.25110  ORF Transcript_22517/g.25110 Transcript_22517/m.25110 type:complete len:487 (-) Transcript_22517:42-1502(-)